MSLENITFGNKMNRSKFLLHTAISTCLPFLMHTPFAETGDISEKDDKSHYASIIEATAGDALSVSIAKTQTDERMHIKSEVKKVLPTISEDTVDIIVSGLCAHVSGMNHIEAHHQSDDHNEQHETLHPFLEKLKTWLKGSEGTRIQQYIFKKEIPLQYDAWNIPDISFSLLDKIKKTYNGDNVTVNITVTGVPSSTEDSFTLQNNDFNIELVEGTPANKAERDTAKKITDYTLEITNGVPQLSIDKLNVGMYTLYVRFNGVEKSTTITITPKELYLNPVTIASKVYDGTTVATLSQGTLQIQDSYIIPGDAVSLEGTPTLTFASKNVGFVDVNISGIKLSGDQAFNYTLILPQNLTGKITPKELTLTGLTATPKTYNGTIDVELIGTPTLEGAIENDNVQLKNPTITGTLLFANAGTHRVTLNNAQLAGNDAANYTLTHEIAGVVNKKEITATITVADKVADTTTAATVSKVVLSGVLDGDLGKVTLAPENVTATFENADAGANKNVSVAYTLTGDAADNYYVTIVTNTPSITAAEEEEEEEADPVALLLELNFNIPGIFAMDPELEIGAQAPLTAAFAGFEADQADIEFTIPSITFKLLDEDDAQVGADITMNNVVVTGNANGAGVLMFNIETPATLTALATLAGNYTLQATIAVDNDGGDGYTYNAHTTNQDVILNLRESTVDLIPLDIMSGEDMVEPGNNIVITAAIRNLIPNVQHTIDLEITYTILDAFDNEIVGPTIINKQVIDTPTVNMGVYGDINFTFDVPTDGGWNGDYKVILSIGEFDGDANNYIFEAGKYKFNMFPQSSVANPYEQYVTITASMP